MSTPREVAELVERFERNQEAYRSDAYNEARLRREFIDPFFKALGWDVDNASGTAEAYKDVIHEDSIKVAGSTKAPDYCFRIGGTRKFFVEAKRPAVNIKQETDAAFQLRRYAWSSKLPLSILTNFREFAIYDCRIKPDQHDPAAMGRIHYLQFGEYSSRWSEVADIFSKDAVLKGLFDKHVEATRGKRGTAEVDSAFLREIESWRESLARNVASRNPELESSRDINFAVQRTIDRIIFLRICEDRGIEPYERLKEVAAHDGIYSRLCVLFQEADERYNSGLFHFYPDKERNEDPDGLTLKLRIDDRVLKGILRNLYYPESPYEFSVLPADILGQVYEQFLGKVIRLTPGHQAKVEDKPEVKKAGGVYYTPTYVVDYIVSQTVAKLLQGRTIKDAAKLRVVDPACGSGSFLIGAYQYLLDWHRLEYENDGPAKHKRVLYQGPGGGWRLTASERRRILLNNIFGVDIDSQAVEVTKLSLLLKVLEGETGQSLTAQLRMFHERALPDLGNNIKCGNSLVPPSFFGLRQAALLDENDGGRINAFDWDKEFPGIMKAGGFDVVLGNPPWGADFGTEELEYLRKAYGRVVARMVDSYIYFLYRSTQLAKPGRAVGFIIPSTILNQVDAKPLRDVLLGRGIDVLINLGQGIFGKKVLNTSTILVSGAPQKTFILDDYSILDLPDRRTRLPKARVVQSGRWSEVVRRDPDLTFFTNLGEAAILDRMRRRHSDLSSLLKGPIQRGVSPDVAEAHVVSRSEAELRQFEGELLRQSVSGQQIKRYQGWECDEFIIYTDRETKLSRYPNIAKWLTAHREMNTCKEVIAGKHPWWSLHRPRDPDIFKSPKFIGLTTIKTIELVYDPDRNAFATDAMYVMSLRDEYDPWAFMAILQSRMFLFVYRVSNQGESRVIPQIKASKLQPLPCPPAETSEPVACELSRLCQQMFALNSELRGCRHPYDGARLGREIEATDREIDRIVYELYGITKRETDVIEDALQR